MRTPTYPSVRRTQLLSNTRSRPRVEGVAHPAHRADKRGLAGSAQLLSQVGDVEVDNVRVHVARPAPDRGERHRARKDLAWALDQGGQQRELPGGQLHPLVSASHHVAHRVKRHVPYPDRAIGTRILGPPRERPHPRQQLGEGEGLGEVVVGRRVEPRHAVLYLDPGGKHQDRRAHLRRAEPPHHHEQVERLGQRQRQGGAPVPARLGRVAFLPSPPRILTRGAATFPFSVEIVINPTGGLQVRGARYR